MSAVPTELAEVKPPPELSVPHLRPSKSTNSLKQRSGLLHIKDTPSTLVIAMVGLPATGKTYMSRKLARYLNWLGYITKLFSEDAETRTRLGPQPASFYAPDNEEGAKERRQSAKAVMGHIHDWFEQGGQAAIVNATMCSAQERLSFKQALQGSPYTGELIWVECICNDEELLQKNISDVIEYGADYAGADRDEAIADFTKRREYATVGYQPVQDEECDVQDLALNDSCSYIKIADCGKKVTSYNIQGYLPGRVVFFLSHVHINTAPVWFTRHGQSRYNIGGKIGGDSTLSDQGAKFASALGQFMAVEDEIVDENTGPLSIWCSTLKRTIQTAELVSTAIQGHARAQEQASEIRAASGGLRRVDNEDKDFVIKKNMGGVAQKQHQQAASHLHGKITVWRALAEIDAGIHDGLTYAEVEDRDPEGYSLRQAKKLSYRYPQGESYLDVIDRLERVIFELERAKGPVLVVGHQAILRCLYGYFQDLPLQDIPHLSVPLHTVIKLKHTSLGCVEERFELLKMNECLSPTTQPHRQLEGKNIEQKELPSLSITAT